MGNDRKKRQQFSYIISTPVEDMIEWGLDNTLFLYSPSNLYTRSTYACLGDEDDKYNEHTHMLYIQYPAIRALHRKYKSYSYRCGTNFIKETTKDIYLIDNVIECRLQNINCKIVHMSID